jgi:BirA family biotin operon repressor/biotin-[acetyl-CoA-carboxylase] ligase
LYIVDVITDCPRRASELLPVRDWRAAEDLAPGDAAFWRALDGGDNPWAGELEGSAFGQVAIVADAPRSQLDALHEAVGVGLALAKPVAAVALTGRGFRGQRGRAWATRPGNLFLVVGLPIHAPAPRVLPGLVALPAVALAEALSGLGAPVTIKWVNDIFSGGAKIGGVLAMSHTRGDLLETAVLGIGLNVAHAPEVAPTRFVPAVTTLAGLGVEPDLGRVLRAVLDAMVQRWPLVAGDPKQLVRAYRRHSCVLGRRVAIWPETDDGALGPPWVSGTVEGIEDDLSLRLAGREEPVASGRLQLLS